MPETNSEPITGTIAITVQHQDNGQYICHLSPSLSEHPSNEIRCYGQKQEHAMPKARYAHANALEKLADDYRSRAEEQQNPDWDVVEHSESGEPIIKHYHLILHYECISEAESKFEAMQHTIMGNTVVENAKITVIETEAQFAR